VTAQYGHADGDYAQVNEQAGIMAGSGGFNVNVQGNTALTGAVISSTADASQNSLSTGTLTFSDVENHSHYSANSIGGSMGLAGNGTQEKAVGPSSVPGSGGIVPMVGQTDSGDQSSTTRSAISTGTITVTDSAHQAQDVAALSRDTVNTNGTVGNTPDVNSILNQQADTMQAAQAAGQVVAQGIGAYADTKRHLAEATGDKATAAAWDEGGDNRTLAHIAGGALIGGLGGGGFGAVGGAAGAGVASAFAGKLNGLADDIGDATGSKLAGNFASNVLAGIGGGLVGGGAGAAAAANTDLYNRQLDPREQPLAKQLADKSNGKYTEAQIEDQMRIMGVCADGSCQSGAADTLKGQAPTDPGARWSFGGMTTDGKPILTQQVAQIDPQLQAYIMTNYNSVAPGNVPSYATYTPSPAQPQTGPQGTVIDTAGTVCPRGDCGAAYTTPSRQQVADAAGSTATQLDRTAAIATAFSASNMSIPYVGTSAETVALWASVGSWFFNGVQQAASPNLGNYGVSSLIGQITGAMSEAYPKAAPLINEFGNMTSNSGAAQSGQDWVNSYWSKIKERF
jgi:filamentous hemagglutinin